MRTARRVAARYLVAKQIPLTADRIRQVQREAEIFAANAEKLDNEADHARVQKAAYAWRNATRPLYGEALKYVVQLADAMPDRKKADRLVATWRSKLKPLFDAVLEVSSFPDWGPHWARLRPAWAQRVRGAAAGLDGVVTFLRTLAKKKMTPQVHQLTTERRTLEGFDVELVEFDADNPAHDDALQVLREALKGYRHRAQQALPLLLKMKLPFIVDFSVSPSLFGASGNYADSHININPFGLGRPKTMTKTLAHEMGHHLFRVWITEPQKAFWRGALAKDWTELDLTEVLAAWNARDEYWANFMTNLMKTDPILYLQISGALDFSQAMPKELRDDEGWSRDNLARYLSSGGKRKIRVPASPITGYAVSNPEEAFCEAVGMLVAYGPRAVLPVVRAWLGIIFDGQVKLGCSMDLNRSRHHSRHS